MSASDYVTAKVKLATGLEEWTFQSGEVAYRSRITEGGKRLLQTWRGINRTEAKAKHKKREGNAVDGKKAPEKKWIADVAVEAYAHLDDLAAINKGSYGTVENHRRNWHKRIETEPIGQMRLDQIERVDCLRFLRKLKQSELAPSTQNGVVSALRVVLRHARDMDYMSNDPFAGIARGEFPSQTEKSEKGHQARVITNEEGQALIAAAKSEEFHKQTDTLFTNMVIVARYQGPRNGEVCGLRWCDVDLINERIGFNGQLKPGHLAKAPVERVAPKNGEHGVRAPRMFSETWAALNDQLAHERSKGLGRPEDLVFTTIVGDPITHRRLLCAVKRAAKLAGLGRVVVKDLRSSFVTAAVHSGLAPVEIETMTGHTATVIERFYAKPIRTAQQEKENVDKMAVAGF